MAPDRRKDGRSRSWVEAACHIRGVTCHTRISNVSSNGCRAEISLTAAAPGDRVVVKLTDLLVLPATVVWICEGQSGLEFASPMAGSMLNQFVLRHGKRGRPH